MSTATASPIAPAGTWAVDPVHSSVTFEIGYLGGTFKGQFREVAAELTVEGGRASLRGSSPVASIDVKDENLSAHLQSPDFFDAERHPTLGFRADDVQLDGETVRVKGELTIRGATREVELAGRAAAPLTDPYGRERVALTLATTVDRTAYGLSWNLALPTGQQALSNEVTVAANLHFVKA